MKHIFTLPTESLMMQATSENIVLLGNKENHKVRIPEVVKHIDLLSEEWWESIQPGQSKSFNMVDLYDQELGGSTWSSYNIQYNSNTSLGQTVYLKTPVDPWTNAPEVYDITIVDNVSGANQGEKYVANVNQWPTQWRYMRVPYLAGYEYYLTSDDSTAAALMFITRDSGRVDYGKSEILLSYGGYIDQLLNSRPKTDYIYDEDGNIVSWNMIYSAYIPQPQQIVDLGLNLNNSYMYFWSYAAESTAESLKNSYSHFILEIKKL